MNLARNASYTKGVNHNRSKVEKVNDIEIKEEKNTELSEEDDAIEAESIKTGSKNIDLKKDMFTLSDIF